LGGVSNYNKKQNVFAAGFYEYAEYAYKTLLVYPQILNGNQPEINFLTGKNSTNNTFTALHKGEAKLFIAGHSLGAAAATILTTLLRTSVDTDNMMTYVVGSPKSIAPSLGKNMNSSDFNIFNIQHPSDIVTWVPFSENEIPFWLLNFIPYLPVFVEQGSFTHINNIEKLDDFNISNLEDNHFIKSFFESFKTHSSNFYINSLHHLSTDNVGAKWEKQKGDDFEKIATKNYIFERGTCRRNSYIEKFDIYGSCHIDAEILKLEGQLDGNNAETYYIDNISHDINPPPRISKYEPSHHILNKYENDAEIQEVINGVFNRNNFESEGIKYNFADLGLKVNPVNQCRVYANGDFTCFNVKSEGTKGEDYYFKFEPDNAVYKLDKKEETKHPNFHFLGIHGK
ncbi:MAG: hypothetical protein KAI79_17905, partial [Bacteroidales bacterium]|nr:hypothetical protein [Bacteroidales bacterium]